MSLEKLSKIVNVGVKSNYHDEDKKKIRIINLAAFFGIIATLSFTFLNVVLDFTELVIIDLCIVFLSFVAYSLNFFHKHSASKFLTLVFLPIAIMVYPLFIGNIGTEYYNFLFLIIGFYVLDRIIYLALLSVFIGSIFILSKYFIYNFSYPEKYKILETVHYYPSLVVSILLIVLVVAIFKFDTLQYQKRISSQNIELEKKVTELAEKNEFANSLLKELNHRVKNNLQLISSLFIMQAYKTSNTQIKQALDEARNRIDTVAIMHQRLYKENMVLESSLKEYINELANNILQSSGLEETIDFEIAIDEISLKIEDTLHVGLIVNELLTNALKHGTLQNLNNKISLQITQNNKILTLKVSDTGPGFPSGFLSQKSDSFGMVLVNAITSQHEGTVNICNNNGAHISIDLYPTKIA